MFHHHPFRSFHLEEIGMIDNHLPLKKRIIRKPHSLSNIDPYYHSTLEYRLRQQPPPSPTPTTTIMVMTGNGSCSETCSVDSGFSENEPLDLSFHSNESSTEEDFATAASATAATPSVVKPGPPTTECSSSSALICPDCNKIYESQARYRAHIRRHESKQSGRYQCTVCLKNFVQRSSLRTHERIHTGEKPYHCIVCQERFGDFSTFTKHRRTHTGEKPYSCPVCCRSFSQSGNMHRHLKVVHKPRPNLYRQWEQQKLL